MPEEISISRFFESIGSPLRLHLLFPKRGPREARRVDIDGFVRPALVWWQNNTAAVGSPLLFPSPRAAGPMIAVCRYRLLTITSHPTQVIVQLKSHADPKSVTITDHIVHDAILNRIADRELIGIPFDKVCSALTDAGAHYALSLECSQSTPHRLALDTVTQVKCYLSNYRHQ
ncbi:hypothetical protein [Burkholderia seminalis]|uniref:hypothetical protein n=1 Tax=Burkholderia seminalis TaxID=488731 RepID=UPI001454305E|nr:hypothetical protein [Burkholderia seminalis]MCA8432415.1 hypothetical protein [Burkholderia seminalis]VWC36947.1 phage integrase family protein [Burkholderia seminalis]